MLGSVIPKRWIVSFALVGLLAVTVSSFSTIWAAPNGTTGTTTGTTPDMTAVAEMTATAVAQATATAAAQATATAAAQATATAVAQATVTATNVSEVLDCGRIAPQDATIASSGSLTLQAIPKALDDTEDPSMPGVTYSWSATGGTVSPTTGGIVAFTPSSGATSAVVTVLMSQANVPTLEREATITIRSAAATPEPTSAPVNPPEPTPVLPTPVAGVEQTVITPAEGGSLTTEDGAVSVDIPVGATDVYMGVQIVPVEQTTEDVPPPPLAFSVGSRVVSIVFTDASGNALTNVVLDRPVQVCVAYTDADAAAADGGVFGLELLRYADPPGEWVALNTTVDPVNKRLCGYTSRFSLFAVGIARAPAGAVPEAVLPATGDYAPSSGLVMSLIGVGAVFVGFGVIALRRRKTKT
ncbi:MAG: hypothetical protein HQ548_06100 [Chloroflexi bacterium]|nr:hypothetical protein [Chloroflexota bacterium]